MSNQDENLLDFSHLETRPSEDQWPTAKTLVDYMKATYLEDVERFGKPHPTAESLAYMVDSLTEDADQLFPDAPNGMEASQAERELEAYHARAVAIMDEAKAEIEAWLKAGDYSRGTDGK